MIEKAVTNEVDPPPKKKDYDKKNTLLVLFKHAEVILTGCL